MEIFQFFLLAGLQGKKKEKPQQGKRKGMRTRI